MQTNGNLKLNEAVSKEKSKFIKVNQRVVTLQDVTLKPLIDNVSNNFIVDLNSDSDNTDINRMRVEKMS